MNRQIKFKAWDNILKEMNVLEGFADNTVFIKGKTRPIVNQELMQFTGLLDKNGKEIYEGDIVQEGTRKDVVEYIESGFSPFAFSTFGDEGYNADRCEIIGNIWENPDLIR